MPENIDISLSLPDGIDRDKVRPYIPLIASNLLIASETIKLRFLQEKGSYTQEDVYKLLFDNWSFWMDVLCRSFKAD